jgi:hypothetical protein
MSSTGSLEHTLAVIFARWYIACCLDAIENVKTGAHRFTIMLVSLVLAAGLTGCKENARPQPPDANSKEMKPVGKLPAEFYGTWKFQGSSGGMDGQGNANYRLEKIVLRAPNTLEEHHAGGTVTRGTFTVGRGKSIFSGGDAWLMQRPNSSMIQVLTLSTNRQLTISENVYDGYSYSFKKVE